MIDFSFFVFYSISIIFICGKTFDEIEEIEESKKQFNRRRRREPLSLNLKRLMQINLTEEIVARALGFGLNVLTIIAASLATYVLLGATNGRLSDKSQ